MTTTNAPSLRTPEGLRAWRAAHGVSQRQLADLLEVGWKGTLSRYENGHLAIPRVIELALRGLEAELRQQAHARAIEPTPVERLIAQLSQEAGESVAWLTTEHYADLDAATVSGSRHAMIRLRKACGLPTFKESHRLSYTDERA